jgi:AGZA family xanthine/uracil permease-like MFS transporter
MEALRRFFQLEERGTTVGTEVRAGVVTFMTMAYIIVVQPMVLAGAGMPVGGVMLATCLSSAAGTLMIALLANYPVAMAPCMGHNFFFTIVVTTHPGLTWQTVLGANFISGSLFVVLSLVGFRERIMDAVPDSLKYAIAVGIGLLIALVGLRGAGLVVETPDASGLTLGKFGKPAVLAVIGLAVTASLVAVRVKGAILIGLIATALVGMGMGLVQPCGTPVSAPPWHELGQTAFKLDIAGALKLGLLSVIFTFFFLDLFDAIGTLIGVTQQAGLMVEGKLPKAREALFSDAAATVVGTLLGTSTVSSYIESSAGVSEGGRTGLASVVTALLFLLAMFFSPCVKMIAGGVQVEEQLAFRPVGAEVTVPFTAEAVLGSDAVGLPEKARKAVLDTIRARIASGELTPPPPVKVAIPSEGTLHVRRRVPLSPVTAPTLILIGCFIMAVVARIPWADWTEAVPAFLAILMMPLTMNITEGIAFGFVAYSLLKAVTGRVREVSPWVLVFAVLFVVRYVYQAAYGL